jgi:predicted enzyme related to lactoylglutathione lyase
MPERTSYKQGTPNWVDLQTTDTEGAKSFYGQLFGWRFEDMPFPAGAGDERLHRRDTPMYSMAFRGEGVVAAIAPSSPELVGQDVPPMWNTYLAVEDVDDTVSAVPGAGGTLAMEPFDVMDAGRMAFVLDPTGAAVGLWQATRHIGATVVNEHGTVGWNELLTSDVNAAVSFYQRVLGLDAEQAVLGGIPWTVLKAGGDVVAGVVRKPTESVPNHWHVYFATDDVTETAARATRLGGTVTVGPVDTPIGSMAGVQDPQGARFSIWTQAPPAG